MAMLRNIKFTTGNEKLNTFLLQLFKFGLAGLPAFIIALPLNWMLVEQAGLPKPVSYLITLFFQVSLNFILLRKFVFVSGKEKNVFVQYTQFLWGIAFFRLLDWLLYMLLVTYTPIHYLVVQVGNVLLFSVFKFIYSRYIMEK